ncbi:allergin-1-like [Dendrobates tinctorius]|uniref:allergin-1-like n=1 Tax=Dendrobates tinctorius TaxID=92724 RepID=UPI003CC97E52
MRLLLLLIFWTSATVSVIEGQTAPEVLSQTELMVKCVYTMIGETETIHCVCRSGSLPITYTLFLNQTTVGKRTVSEERDVAFNVTIYDDTRLGSYKCKANNSLKYSPYSAGFSFTLQDKLSIPHVTVNSFVTTIGSMEPIVCSFAPGSPPITYSLRLGSSVISSATVWKERSATFYASIHNVPSLGPYTCAANRSDCDVVLSDQFTFVLSGPTSPWLHLGIRLLAFINLLLLTLTVQMTVYSCRQRCEKAALDAPRHDTDKLSSEDFQTSICGRRLDTQ